MNHDIVLAVAILGLLGVYVALVIWMLKTPVDRGYRADVRRPYFESTYPMWTSTKTTVTYNTDKPTEGTMAILEKVARGEITPEQGATLMQDKSNGKEE